MYELPKLLHPRHERCTCGHCRCDHNDGFRNCRYCECARYTWPGGDADLEPNHLHGANYGRQIED